MDTTHWHRQNPTEPLYPDIEWSRPERRGAAGKLAIMGGTVQGFLAVSESHRVADELGVGHIRVIVPDSLRRAIPRDITEALFTRSTPSGGIADDPTIRELLAWCDLLLLPGDNGRSAETASVLEHLLATDRPLVATRDAADALIPSGQRLVTRPATTLVLSIAQLQKLFRSVYYPKMITFSISLTLLVEQLHKFTLSYPITLVTFHHQQLIAAHDGRVTTTPLDNPMPIWRGTTAARAACYLLWSPTKPLEAVTTSFV